MLPVLAKIFEKCISLQLNQFVAEVNILPTCQSGFRSGYGCVTAPTTIVDDIIQESDAGNITVLVLLDFSRTFDTVLDHASLFSIPGCIGMSDFVVKFFEAYLRDRTHRVVVDSNTSTPIRGLHEVPQGAILGPMLFNIYTSNLPQTLKYCKYQLYADDTQLYYSFPPTQSAEA